VSAPPAADLRRVLIRVAALNLGYFVVEGAAGLWSGSAALLVDSVDFLEDAALNLLILVGLGWPLAARLRLATLFVAIMALPALAALWTLARALWTGAAPEPGTMTLAALGALAVNVAAAAMIARVRHGGGALMRAAWLSARNDALGNVAIVAAGLLVAATASAWPDIAVAGALAVLHGDAAREVWNAARAERAEARP
jgi:Co/Zn/Cd efflux system component